MSVGQRTRQTATNNKMKTPKKTHVVRLTAFGAQQYRAMLISRLGMSLIGCGVKILPVTVTAGCGYEGDETEVIHPIVNEVRKEQAKIKTTPLEQMMIQEIAMGRKKKVTNLDAARELGFKKEKCQFFVESVTSFSEWED